MRGRQSFWGLRCLCCFGTSVPKPKLLLLLTALLALALPALSPAASVSALPAPLQVLSSEELVHLFSVDFEPPNLAAEIARHHAWAPNPADAEDLIPGFVQVLRTYPGTADARRALLDIAQIYVDKKKWDQAEAPFRYVMDVAQGKPEARIAHLRLLEMYTYSGAPDGVDPVAELQAAAKTYAGTPEEGLAKMLLGDLLVKNGKYGEGFVQYRDVIAASLRSCTVATHGFAMRWGCWGISRMIRPWTFSFQCSTI